MELFLEIHVVGQEYMDVNSTVADKNSYVLTNSSLSGLWFFHYSDKKQEYERILTAEDTERSKTVYLKELPSSYKSM